MKVNLRVECPRCGKVRYREYGPQRAKQLHANGYKSQCSGKCGYQGQYKKLEGRRQAFFTFRGLDIHSCGKPFVEEERQEMGGGLSLVTYRCLCTTIHVILGGVA